MRLLLVGIGGLVGTLLLPLLFVAALLGSLPAATTAPGAASGPGSAAHDLPQPVPFTGSSTSCTATDPTGGRCLTPASRHAWDEIVRVLGPPGPGSPIRSASCCATRGWPEACRS